MDSDPVDAAMAAASGSYAQPSGDPVDAAMATAAATGSSSPAPAKAVLDVHSMMPANPINDFVAGAFRRGVSSVAGAVAGGLHGLYDIAMRRPVSQAASDVASTESALTSKPTDAAQAAGAQALQSNFDPLNWPGLALGKGGQYLGDTAERLGAPPSVSTALDVLPTAAAMLDPLAGAPLSRAAGAGVRALVHAPYDVAAERVTPSTPEEVLANSVNPQQSMGAAAAAPNLVNASPNLRAGIVAGAQKAGGAVNPDIAARHLEADSLPVPIQLSEGQATRDPQLYSIEQNERGRNPVYAQQFQQQEARLVQNLRAIRDEAGPDVFSANPVEHGDTLINAYKAKDATAEADINAKYQALRDAAGGEFPVDAGKILDGATQALHKQLLFEHAPSAVMNQLSGMAENGMTFEQFEALRTNLATIARTSSDGLERRAAGVIRNQMEQLPLEGGAANLKPLADAARSAAKAHFDELDADPAYAAAVDGSVPPDRFVQRFVVGAPRDQVALMAQNLGDDPVARQTMAVGAIDHLRQSAGIDALDNGRFRQSGFNRQLQALGPKLSSIVDPRTAESLEKLGNVARNIQEAPPGSFVNTSNTLTGALAEHARDAVEHLINAKAGGIPVATMARNAMGRRAAVRQAAESFRPAAGVERLSSVVPKP